MKWLYINIWVVLLSVNLLYAAPGYDSTYSYKLKPVQKSERVNMTVTLSWQAKSDTAITISLLEDYYSVPDLNKYIIRLEGKNGCRVKENGKANQRIVIPAKNRHVTLEYEISYNPVELDEYSFGPVTGNGYFHFAGCQWMLQLDDISKKRKYTVTILPPGKTWKFYSSISENALRMSFIESYENLISTVIGGGTQPTKTFLIKGKPLYVFAAGQHDVPVNEIFAATHKIVSLQREWFNDYEHPYFLVTILPRSSIVAGTAVPNAFICFLKKDATQMELNGLLSHEMFHVWLPNKMSITQEKGEYAFRHDWLNEGFTDYFSRKLLIEAGMLTETQFVNFINRHIINIADNPDRNKTYRELGSSNFSTPQKKLGYSRGTIMALNWDAALQANGSSLKQFILDLYNEARKNNGSYAETFLFEFGKRYGIDIQEQFEKHILQGESIAVSPFAFAGKFELTNTEVPSFDPGFSLSKTFSTKTISDVKPDGPAYKAGLRNGMAYTGIRNSNRFGNNWYWDKPMKVFVKIDGVEKEFAFMPQGAPITVSLYKPKK